ncbi:hypothetical protein N8588_01105 [Akkermansiaceae bacterium]|nr:hypothetical protein [Akkermansiaceae bacterium]MDB4424278.1 hypothetical protein [Akkermansiaceae bacterium]
MRARGLICVTAAPTISLPTEYQRNRIKTLGKSIAETPREALQMGGELIRQDER